MIPTGSRFLLGATALAIFTTILYASIVWGALGTVGLIFVSVALGVITGLNLYVRDADVSTNDPLAATDSPAAHQAPQSSLWPIVSALGGVLLVVGLISYPVVFVFGVIAVLAATIEWMIEAWSERASGSRIYNGEVRERIAHPAEFPVLAAFAVGVLVYSFSRIMVFLSKAGAPIAFGLIAAMVLLTGVVIATRPQLRSSTVSAVAAIAVLGLVAGGVAAALAGERELEPHETTAALATEGHCDTAEETHADNEASQTVGAKANVAAEITLRSDGTLVSHALGIEGESDQLVVTRSNPTNVLFINETSEVRRLVLDLGPTESDAETTVTTETTETTEPTETTETTEPTAAGTEARKQECTALVEEDGTQMLTFEIGIASSDDLQYQFFVPGVDGATIEVIVP